MNAYAVHDVPNDDSYLVYESLFPVPTALNSVEYISLNDLIIDE